MSVTLEDAVKIQQIQDNQVAGEQQWLNLNSGTHFMKDQEFWNNLTNEAYVDINIIFKAGIYILVPPPPLEKRIIKEEFKREEWGKRKKKGEENIKKGKKGRGKRKEKKRRE